MRSEREERFLPQPIADQPIVCGNCGGDRLLPDETFLTPDGHCSQCGGRSYVPAETIYRALMRNYKNGGLKKHVNNSINRS